MGRFLALHNYQLKSFAPIQLWSMEQTEKCSHFCEIIEIYEIQQNKRRQRRRKNMIWKHSKQVLIPLKITVAKTI